MVENNFKLLKQEYEKRNPNIKVIFYKKRNNFFITFYKYLKNDNDIKIYKILNDFKYRADDMNEDMFAYALSLVGK